MGVSLYDLLTLGRNRRITDGGRRIPGGRLITRQEALNHFPGIEQRGLTGAAIFYDAQMYSPQRIALSFLRSAASAGADIANYMEVTGFLKSDGRIVGVRAKDLLRGESLEVRERWCSTRRGPGRQGYWKPGWICLWRRSRYFPGTSASSSRAASRANSALACQTRTRDADALLSRGGRHLFLAPWRNFTLIGVWHGVYRGAPEEVTVTEEELQAFLDETNAAYPGLSLTRKDVTMVNFGLILFEENKQGTAEISFGKTFAADRPREGPSCRRIGHPHRRPGDDGPGGGREGGEPVFLETGEDSPRFGYGNHADLRWPYRSVRRFLGRAVERRPYGLDRDVLDALVHNYGSEYPGVLKYIDGIRNRPTGWGVRRFSRRKSFTRSARRWRKRSGTWSSGGRILGPVVIRARKRCRHAPA